MDNEKMGRFISELRKSNQMTQKDLAEKLNVSDKAVSKWERGLSCPDITLLTPLSTIFGITTTELLNGEKSGSETANVETSIVNVLQYADKAVKRNTRSIQNICFAVFSSLLLLGILTVSIVDLALSRAFSWSLIPISASVFMWLVCGPMIKLGIKGILGSLIALSLLLIPFLYVLDRLIENEALIFSIGLRVSVISLAFLWIVFGVFKLLKSRKLLASAASLFLAIPLTLFLNLTLSRVLDIPLFDVWDAMGISIIALTAITLLIIDFVRRKKTHE